MFAMKEVIIMTCFMTLLAILIPERKKWLKAFIKNVAGATKVLCRNSRDTKVVYDVAIPVKCLHVQIFRP